MTQRREKTWGDTYAAQAVVTYTPLGPVNHLKVRRHDGGTNHLTWDELMVIKNEMLGEEALAVEIYPRDRDVENEANIRHLWELPEGFLPGELVCRSEATGIYLLLLQNEGRDKRSRKEN